jgi:hypothetical protein
VLFEEIVAAPADFDFPKMQKRLKIADELLQQGYHSWTVDLDCETTIHVHAFHAPSSVS